MRLLCDSCDNFSIEAATLGDGTKNNTVTQKVQDGMAARKSQSKHTVVPSVSTFTPCV